MLPHPSLTLRTPRRSRQRHRAPHRCRSSGCCWRSGGHCPAAWPSGTLQTCGWLSPWWPHPTSALRSGARASCPPAGSAPPGCLCTCGKGKGWGHQGTALQDLCEELQGSWKHWPFKVCDVLVIGLAADVYDFGQQLVSVRRPFSFIHVNHQFLHNLHQILLGDLLKRWWRVQSLSYTAKSFQFQ